MAFAQASVLSRAARLLVAAAFVTASACSPHKPSPPPPPSLVSITIDGTLSLTQPGDTGRLTATATFSDQTSRDVTAEAQWSSPSGVVAVTAGSVTAVRYGQADIVARYTNVTAVAPARVAPPGAFLINGVVRSEIGTPLAHALVEFFSRCGTMSVETDDRGMYWLPADGETTMRISLDSYIPLEKQLVVEADRRVDVELQAVDVPGSISGNYTLTVTPSPSCAFASDLFPRRYGAHIRDVRGNLVVELSGAEFVGWGSTPGFTGTRDGSTVRFVLRIGFEEDYEFIELLPSGGYLGYSGTGLGDVSDGQIRAAFNGSIGSCTAADHRFELVLITR